MIGRVLGGILCAISGIGLGHVSTALAGPVVLGGDDLADHGSFNVGTNENVGGWLYLEKAVQNILEPSTNITRTNDGSIAALGSASSTANSQDPGAAIRRVGLVLGKTVNFFNGAAAINQFFTHLATGAVKPAMIWIPGENDDEPNTLDAAEAAALKANASAIASFVNSGGGLMSHGCDSSDDTCKIGAYDWLSALIPGLAVEAGCDNDTAALTVLGQAAFPGLTDDNLNETAGGECHNHFTGNRGSLKVLAVEGGGGNFILGGGVGTEIRAGSVGAPMVGPSGLLALVLALAIAGQGYIRKRGPQR